MERIKDVSADACSVVDMCPYLATQIILQEPTQQLSDSKIFGCFEHQLDSCFYVLLVILRQKDFYWHLGDILVSCTLYPDAH